MAFYIPNAPALIARKDAAREADKNVQHVATFVVAPLTLVASFVLLFMPSLLHGSLGWVPHFGQGRGSVQALDSTPAKFLSSRDSLSSAFRTFSRIPDLPKQEDVWVASLALDSDSKLKYVGKTRDYVITSTTTVKDLNNPRTISVGDEIEGIRIGAIQCSFFWRDQAYGGEQFMWRGRWGCQAGRSKDEVEHSVGPDGEKRFAYLHISPVSLKN